MQALAPGWGMLALQATAATAESLVQGMEQWVSIAAVNAPESTVVSGRLDELAVIETRAAAAKIHLLSASIATYYFAKSLRARRVSAWRNAAVALFGTDAVKPLLKPQKSFRTAA